MDVRCFQDVSNYLKIFYDKNNKCLYDVKEEPVLTNSIIDTLKSGHCIISDKRNFSFNVVNVYSVHSKWVVFFERRHFGISTSTEKGIIVFDEIEATVKSRLSSGLILEDDVIQYTAF